MKVRCGACRSEVQIQGPGRFNCPACGSPNEVRPPAQGAPAGMPPEGDSQFGGMATPPPQPAPEPTSPKAICGSCEFSFIVGNIEVAECPNCGTEVQVTGGDGLE